MYLNTTLLLFEAEDSKINATIIVWNDIFHSIWFILGWSADMLVSKWYFLLNWLFLHLQNFHEWERKVPFLSLGKNPHKHFNYTIYACYTTDLYQTYNMEQHDWKVQEHVREHKGEGMKKDELWQIMFLTGGKDYSSLNTTYWKDPTL